MTQAQPLSLLPRTSAKPSGAELALNLLGPSTAMTQLWAQIRRLAPHIRTVLLTGEPDCGQEAIAHLLLDFSPQSHRSFLLLTAAEAESRLLRASALASFPSDVLVFIPDVHRLSLQAQEAVVRLLRLRRARPFTLVAGTSEELRALVGMGRFLPELAELLSAVRVTVPSLRQRAEDIPMLASQVLASYSLEKGQPALQPAEDFLRAAMEYTWPGNLGELTATLRRLAATSRGDVLHAADLTKALHRAQPARAADPAPVRLVPLDTVLQEHIAAVLRACRGNKLRAAEVLGISRSTLYRMLDAAAAAQPAPLSLAS